MLIEELFIVFSEESYSEIRIRSFWHENNILGRESVGAILSTIQRKTHNSYREPERGSHASHLLKRV